MIAWSCRRTQQVRQGSVARYQGFFLRSIEALDLVFGTCRDAAIAEQLFEDDA